jgi:membrane-bound lytic murein transglycosylase B
MIWRFVGIMGKYWAKYSLKAHTMINLKQTLLILLAAAVFPSSQAFSRIEKVSFTQKEQNFLIEKFTSDKVDASFASSVFRNKNVKKYPNVLPKNINNKEVKRNYSTFFDSYSKHRTKKFMRRWRTRFKNAEEKYQVDKEAIAAIILVETGLGSIRGRYSVLSVFASIVVEATEALKGEVSDVARYNKKLNWATEELHAALELGKSGQINVVNLKGSRSGAFGMSQFLPSSFQRWAVDGDGNGKINLEGPADVIASTANYLKQHGWVLGIQSPENRKAVYDYNNSQIYVDTILKVAESFTAFDKPKK